MRDFRVARPTHQEVRALSERSGESLLATFAQARRDWKIAQKAQIASVLTEEKDLTTEDLRDILSVMIELI